MKKGIVLDIGGTKIRDSLITDDLVILETKYHETPHKSKEKLIDIIVEIVLEAKKKEEIKFIGIDIPGITRERSYIVTAPNLRDFDNIALADILEDKLGIRPVVIDDRLAYTRGELNHYGSQNMVVFLIGTGIGAGIVCDGNIIKGSRGITGIIGWNVSREYLGKKTRIGFLEEKISGRGIEKLMRRNAISAKEVFRASDSGDPMSAKTLEMVSNELVANIINISNLLNTELFILNGTVGIELGKRFSDSMNKKVRENGNKYVVENVKVITSELKEKAPLIGLAIEAMDID